MFGFEAGYAVGKLEDGIGRVFQFVKTLCLNARHHAGFVQFGRRMRARGGGARLFLVWRRCGRGWFGRPGIFREYLLIENDDVHAAVMGAAFLGIVGIHGYGVGVAGDGHALPGDVVAGGEQLEHGDAAGGGQFPVAAEVGPCEWGWSRYGLRAGRNWGVFRMVAAILSMLSKVAGSRVSSPEGKNVACRRLTTRPRGSR